MTGVVRGAAAAGLAAWLGWPGSVSAAPDRLLEALERIEVEHAALCPAAGTAGTGVAAPGGAVSGATGSGDAAGAGRSGGTRGAATLERWIEALAARVRADEDPGEARGTEGVATVESLNRLLFEEVGLRASTNVADPCNLLPSRVLERRQGYCVGIAAVYLLLAERLSLPVHAVGSPSHLFLRYDDGATRLNIETFEGGAHHPDELYVREHRIPERAIRRGVFLRDLTMDGFLAQVHNNLGVIHSERKEYGRAGASYREALRLLPDFPAARYNLGNDRLALGDFKGAIRSFSRALRLHPDDVYALNNRGLAYLKAGKAKRARRDFRRALEVDPGFDAARRNLDALAPG